MKKTILISALMLFSLISIGQTLIHTDTIFSNTGTIMYKWYHEGFIDSDNPFNLISNFSLTKKYIVADTTYVVYVRKYKRYLSIGDSIKNPYGNNYFQSYLIIPQLSCLTALCNAISLFQTHSASPSPSSPLLVLFFSILVFFIT